MHFSIVSPVFVNTSINNLFVPPTSWFTFARSCPAWFTCPPMQVTLTNPVQSYMRNWRIVWQVSRNINGNPAKQICTLHLVAELCSTGRLMTTLTFMPLVPYFIVCKLLGNIQWTTPNMICFDIALHHYTRSTKKRWCRIASRLENKRCSILLQVIFACVHDLYNLLRRACQLSSCAN